MIFNLHQQTAHPHIPAMLGLDLKAFSHTQSAQEGHKPSDWLIAWVFPKCAVTTAIHTFLS